MMKDFEEYRISDEDLAQIAGGQQLVRVEWDESFPGGRRTGGMSIEAGRLDEYKQRLIDRGKDLQHYKFSKPYNKGETPVFE